MEIKCPSCSENVTIPPSDSVRKLVEALEWAWSIADERLSPFEGGTDLREQTSHWRCWGCKGVFYSKWPDWIKPTDETFQHEKDCEYLKSKAALTAYRKEMEK